MGEGVRTTQFENSYSYSNLILLKNYGVILYRPRYKTDIDFRDYINFRKRSFA